MLSQMGQLCPTFRRGGVTVAGSGRRLGITCRAGVKGGMRCGWIPLSSGENRLERRKLLSIERVGTLLA